MTSRRGSTVSLGVVRGRAEQLVVGFDLDMTLIDTVPGFAATLIALGEELEVDFPIDDIIANLGPPLESLLAGQLPQAQLKAAGDRFRALYPTYAIEPVRYLAGAQDALAAVRRRNGRIVVVTGKFPQNAQLHVDHLHMDIDVLEGWVWGAGKAEVLRREGAQVYVGDHVHDVEGALAAEVLSVSVTTGGCTSTQLAAAGSHVVLNSLEEFSSWFDAWPGPTG